jgi:hypothetical protein
VFVAEGRLVVRRLLASRFVTRSVMVTPAALDGVAGELEGRPCLPVFVVPQPVMNAVAGFDIHRGCLAIGERPAPVAWAGSRAAARNLVALEHVGNADNVGATFRAAAAFGAGGVLLDDGCADPLYRKAIRTSMGAALHVPFAPDVPWTDALAGLRREGGPSWASRRPRAPGPRATCSRRRAGRAWSWSLVTKGTASAPPPRRLHAPRAHTDDRRRGLAECRHGSRHRAYVASEAPVRQQLAAQC